MKTSSGRAVASRGDELGPPEEDLRPIEERVSSSPRGSITWVSALMNHRFVRSFSERLVGGKRARAESWWRKLRAQKLTGESFS
ncbi:hypothetical protein IscW_ISCW005561 [Ixodes scapularis]|uniref:Uncharacterized protein n=1 Tax=Ixodes scapularis TaxID=6945 RepID=B7PR49_IXOSC|nr:hypothetical protein IscW_ISCW005561 [Ixodes scapularis]|eukprot:XP_002436241.1 hypothetical protein IscW_ISCW005561 [Ixodes scapularis]